MARKERKQENKGGKKETARRKRLTRGKKKKKKTEGVRKEKRMVRRNRIWSTIEHGEDKVSFCSQRLCPIVF